MKIINYTKKFASLTFAATIGTTCLLSQNQPCRADTAGNDAESNIYGTTYLRLGANILVKGNAAHTAVIIATAEQIPQSQRTEREPLFTPNELFMMDNSNQEQLTLTVTLNGASSIFTWTGKPGQDASMIILLPSITKDRQPVRWTCQAYKISSAAGERFTGSEPGTAASRNRWRIRALERKKAAATISHPPNY
ncbi:MAG: hypothetical protein LBJ95_04925 [Oscillospiraceae bacterium]|jgi:hypothetical protein|nr:hypothetical protein [Oscillospiraceae bacterium]